MKTKFIKYMQNKDDMLSKALIEAGNNIKDDQTIWLVWTDKNNLRGYFFNNDKAILSRENIKDLMDGRRLPLRGSYLESISLNKISEIKKGDIAIDCFTGGELNKNLNNIAELIYLPWTQDESNQFQNNV